MSDDLVIRVKSLEKVVNNILSTNIMSKGSTSKGKNSPAGPVEGVEAPATGQVADSSTIKMVYPAYKVPWQGRTIKVTVETLAAEPELLAHMRATYPECFVV